MPESNRMYTTQEAAELLDMSDGNLRNLIRTGKAHPKKQVGGTWIFTKNELERLRNRPKSKGGRPKKLSLPDAIQQG